MALKTHGTMAVDWESRIDFDRLRRERLQKAKDLLAQSSMGSLLCFDMNNVRYLTSTHIGTWAQDKANRFTLLPQNDEPILWDFGSAAKHHQLNCPWLGERSRPGISRVSLSKFSLNSDSELKPNDAKSYANILYQIAKQNKVKARQQRAG